MRLLLTHGFFLTEDAKEQAVMRPYPPLGILYIAAYLRERGFDVAVYDSTFGTREELFQMLDDGPPAMLGIYGNLLTRSAVLAIMERARATGWTVVLGGPEPSNYATEYLEAGAHHVISGEGERALEQLLSGQTPTPIAQIEDLDTLPWPAREMIDLDAYLRAWKRHHGASSVSLITARGCPYSCRWCSHSTFGQTHRRRSVNNVADEVEWIASRYNPDLLWYADDVFTIHTGWSLQYAAELKRRGIRIPFECITRADRLNESVADALAEMGCFRVWVGSESGSQRVLDAMQRGVRVEQVQRAVDILKARGIAAGMFLMWGYEGEQFEDIEATVSHVQRCQPDTFLTTVTYPLKGTHYFNEVSGRLVSLKDWSQSTDRDLRIRGRHSRRYYSFADELLRAAMASTPDPVRIASARDGLRVSAMEVEA
ncbi:MAG: radical SAM protein [Acidobacteriota bacterium]